MYVAKMIQDEPLKLQTTLKLFFNTVNKRILVKG